MRGLSFLVLLTVVLVAAVWLLFGGSRGGGEKLAVEPGGPERAFRGPVTVATAPMERESVTGAPETGGRMPVHWDEQGPVARLAGKVSGGSELLEGVLVAAYERPLQDQFFRATTDAKGEFDLSLPKAGLFDVVFRHPDWSQLCVEGLRVREGEVTRVEVVLSRASPLTVVVLQGGASGPPVPGARVTALPGSFGKASFYDAIQHECRAEEQTTDATGSAVIPGMAAGPCCLVVQADGLKTWQGEVQVSSAHARVQVVLDAAGELSGTVRESSGKPAPGAWVFVSPEKLPPRVIRGYYYSNSREVTTADEQGAFRFTGVPGGRHYLAAVLRNGEVAVHRDSVAVEEGAATVVDLDAPRGGTLQGVVRDRSGRPLANAKVYVSTTQLHPEGAMMVSLATGAVELLKRSTTTGDDGRYSLGNVRTGIEVKLVGSLDGYERDERQLDIEPGETRTQDLELFRLDGTVSGSVVTDNGEPVPEIAIAVEFPLEGEREFKSVAKSAADGRFSLLVPTVARPGRAKLMLRVKQSQAYEPEPREYEGISAGRQDLRFVLSPRQRVHGQVVDGAGAPVRFFEVSAFNDVRGKYREPQICESDQGEFDVPFHPEEDLYLRFNARGYAPFDLYELERRVEKDLLVRLQPLEGLLRGQVVDASGAPVAGAFVMRSGADRETPFPWSSSLAPVATTDSGGAFALEGLRATDSGTLLVAPGLETAPLLARFDLQESAQEGLVLRLPSASPVSITVRSRTGNPLKGHYGIFFKDGFPAFLIDGPLAANTPRFPGLDELGEPATLSLRLAPGRYSFVYWKDREKEQESVDAFELAVELGRDNRFTFEVGS